MCESGTRVAAAVSFTTTRENALKQLLLGFLYTARSLPLAAEI